MKAARIMMVMIRAVRTAPFIQVVKAVKLLVITPVVKAVKPLVTTYVFRKVDGLRCRLGERRFGKGRVGRV